MDKYIYYNCDAMDKSLINKFLMACMNGDIGEVISCVKSNKAYIYVKLHIYNDAKSDHKWIGYNGFRVACQYGMYEVAKYLYDCDNTVSQCTSIYGTTIFEGKIDETCGKEKIISFLNEIKQKCI